MIIEWPDKWEVIQGCIYILYEDRVINFGPMRLPVDRED